MWRYSFHLQLILIGIVYLTGTFFSLIIPGTQSCILSITLNISVSIGVSLSAYFGLRIQGFLTFPTVSITKVAKILNCKSSSFSVVGYLIFVARYFINSWSPPLYSGIFSTKVKTVIPSIVSIG